MARQRAGSGRDGWRVGRSKVWGGQSLTGTIPWFDEEAYARLVDIVKDPVRYTRSYDLWRQMAEGDESRHKRPGVLILRIEIDPDAFLAWCVARGVDPDSRQLDGYAHEISKTSPAALEEGRQKR